jgi:hypothetical protein
MFGIFTKICPKNHPNVGKYTYMEHMGSYPQLFQCCFHILLKWFKCIYSKSLL